MHRTSRPLLLILMMLFMAQSGFQLVLAGMESAPGHESGAHRMADGHGTPAADANRGGGHHDHHHAGESCTAYQCSACLANLPPIGLETVDIHNAPDLPYTSTSLAGRHAASLFRPPRA